MTYVITDACAGTKDLSCAAVCPVDCIYELEQMCVVSPDECIDCGACQSECPVEAIVPEHDVPADLTEYIAVNAAWDEGGAEAAETRLQVVRGG